VASGSREENASEQGIRASLLILAEEEFRNTSSILKRIFGLRGTLAPEG
jgi:hypothetical protein